MSINREERSAIGLEGLLPPGDMSLEEQAERSHEQYRAQPTDLAKSDFLAALHDSCEVLYYKLLEDHLKEMLPVVYGPALAQATQRYSHEFQRRRGVYLSVDDIDSVEAALRNYGLGADDVDLLVATDAEEILGIGDSGASGMGVSIGKPAVYTAAGGVDPHRVIPVMLDVGTDPESRRGERYDLLLATYVEAANRLFPHALLHFEHFSPSNARRILNQYRDRAPVFNDDVQGTGAIALAAILAGMRVAGTRPSDQRVVIFGSGTAGVGIADQIRVVMIGDGLSAEEATRRFWLVDKQGLLVEDMSDLRDFQQPYARPRSEVSEWGAHGTIGLAEVVGEVRPTIIVGTSSVGGAFTEPIVREMAKHVQRPMIFPLSNPTERIEAVPANVIKWTDGRGLVGAGTPWDPVFHKGTEYTIGQADNALIYPGIALGTIVSRACHVTDGMLLAAAEAVAALVDVSRPGAGLLPDLENLRAVSATVAVAVARQAIEDGVAQAELPDPVQAVQQAMWSAVHPKTRGEVKATIVGSRLRSVPIGTGATGTRVESDWMGEVEVPAEHYWGAQTQRSLIRFSIGDDRMPTAIYHAYGYVKKAAALVNSDAGRLHPELAAAVVAAADEVIAGKLDSEFPLYVWQTGSGTQSNMNVNEVIANRASQLLGGELGSKHPVHPNDHVNMGQSSSDTFPTAMHIATLLAIREHTLPRLNELIDAIWSHAVRREWSGWAVQLREARVRLELALEAIRELAAGGTAAGAGLDSPDGFSQEIVATLAELTDLPLQTAPNRFAALGSMDGMVAVSAGLRGLAVALMKIANDMRWLAPGPRAGLYELELPANERGGSSSTPERVNPTQQEAMVMVCLQVIGEDSIVASAGAQGNFELGTMRPIIINNVLHSARILGDAIEKLRQYSIAGTELDCEPNTEDVGAAKAMTAIDLQLTG